MESSFALVGLAIALFASTNVDDVLVLVGFFADPKFRDRDVVIGQYAGIAALFGVSVFASLLSLVIPRAYLGLLGIAAILIGTQKLLDLWRGRDKPEETLERHSNAGTNGRTATVAFVTIANGGDNVGIYAPSFAIRSRYEIAMIALVFVLMTALWCFAAQFMVNHPKLGAPIRRYGHRVAPFVFIGLGILVLHQAGSFRLLFHHSGS
jgi:cadmium resistance protein CadD (predicted permease)